MAIFDPVVSPTQDPNYTRDSNAIRPEENLRPHGLEENSIKPKGEGVDESGGVFYKGLAAGVSGIATGLDFAGKVVDTLVKQDIDDRLTKSLDAERLRYEAQLKRIDGLSGGGSAAAAASANMISYGGGNPGDQGPHINMVTPGAPSNMSTPPKSLTEDLPGELDMIVGARDNGKISPTFYYARLNDIAKSYRMQHPSKEMRDFIDQTIAKRTGINPANALIESMTADINAGLANSKSQFEKTLARIETHIDLPGADKIAAAFRSGAVDANYIDTWLNKNLSNERYWKYKENESKFNDMGREQKKVEHGIEFNTFAGQAVQNSFENITTPAGLGNPTNVLKFLDEVNSGKRPRPDDTQMQQLGEVLKSEEVALKARLQKQAVQQGWMTSLGPEEVEKRTNAITSQYRQVSDLILNKDYGSAFHAQNYNKAINEDVYSKLLKSDMGGQLLVLNSLKRAGGEQFIGTIFTQMVAKGFIPKINAFVSENVMGMANGSIDKDTGLPVTAVDAINQAEKGGITDPKVFDTLVRTPIERLVDPTTPDTLKINLAKAIFAPEKGTALIDKDWRDKKGNPMRANIFQALTSPEVRDEVWKLKDKAPQVWSNYKNFVEASYGTLTSRDAATIKDIQQYPKLGITWNSDSYKFGLLVNGKDITVNKLNPSDVTQMRTALGAGGVDIQTLQDFQKVINRINNNTSAIAGVAEKEPNFDVEAYLLRTLNVDPTLGNTQGMPEKFTKAIIASREDLKKKEEERKKRWESTQ